jgi:hypothetical protein
MRLEITKATNKILCMTALLLEKKNFQTLGPVKASWLFHEKT